jgi:type II secretory pathway pseudopilin PulG
LVQLKQKIPIINFSHGELSDFVIKVKRHLKKENGITLIEVIASVALLAIIAGPLLGTAMTAFKTNLASREKTEAIALAERVMEEIKSQKVLAVVKDARFGAAGSTSLVPIYSIESAGEGKISPEEGNSYDPDEADNPDLELLIDQGDSEDENISGVELKILHADGGEKVISLGQNLNYRETDLNLKICKSGSNFICDFGKELPSGSELTEFTPSNPDSIKLKVSCRNDGGDPNSDKMLKLFTYMDNEAASKLKIYVTGTADADDSGVNIINKGEGGYEINYMSTEGYNYALPVNQLYKIIVTIKGKKGNDIYTASSYVKK